MYLSRAMATVPELRNIKVTADLMQYDDSLSHKPKRLIYSHEIGEEWGGDAHQEYEETYDIDTPVSYIEANAHMRKPRRQKGQAMGSSPHKVMIPREVWHALSNDFKVAWNNLSEEEKTMILSTGQVSTTTRMAQLHERSQDEDVEEEFQDALDDAPAETGQDSDQVQVHNTQQQPLPKFPPYDIRSILSSKGKATSTRSGHMCVISKPVVYRVSSTAVISKQSLVDRGANGGIAGQDCKVICMSDRTVDVQGIDNHQLNSVSIGTAAGYVNSNKGPVILILHQYALVGRGHTIHSPGQLEWFKHSVCDKSVHVGGLQRIKTADGYTIPIAMVHGLPRVRMRPPTDKEFDTLPHIVLTSDNTWDPSVLDFDHEEEDDQWFDAIEHQEAHPYSELFDEYGNYRRRVIVQLSDTLSRPSSDPHEHLIDLCIVHANREYEPFFFDAQSHSINETSPLVAPSTPRTSSASTPDYETLRPMFGWISVDAIKKTLQHTTQLARTTTGTLLKKVYRSQNPALNVIQRGEPVATDELFSDTPAVDCGATRCQVFVGMNTDVTDIYPLQTSKQFVNSLEDNVRFRGAPTKLVSDRAPVEISGRALEFLRVYGISTWHSEPHQQHQNYAEHKIQHLKQMANTIMDRTGAPASTWLLCLMYVAFLLNHTWSDNIKAVPLTALLGVTVDTSVLLRYHFWQPVHFKAVEPGFPSDTKEQLGHVVGISEHVGHALTWKVLDSTTNKVLHRSLLRPANETAPNLCLATLGGEDPSTVRPTIFSKSFDTSDDGTKRDDPMDEGTKGRVLNEKGDALVQLSDLVGMTFLTDPQPDGQIFRARVVEMIDNHDDEVESHPDRIKFLCKMDKNGREDLLTYNQVLDYLNRDMENPVLWKYKKIVSHQGPLKQGDKDYKGSAWNVIAVDEDGTLCMEQRKYLEKMIDGYVRFFGSKPRTNACAPLERGDHPEMDTSPFLDEEKTKIYQSLIGALQWIITIGRFDVFSAVTTMSSFRAAPRKGHLERIKRIYSYLHKMSDGKIWVRVEEPDYSGLPIFEFDWSRTVYGFMSELLPKDAPEPLGKWVTLTHFVDANLMHDLVTGRSLTGILHLLNKTPIDWYSKKQATVETATYGSEMVAMRTCVEQVVDLRNTLRYLSVPIRDKSYIFGDNESNPNPYRRLDYFYFMLGRT
ncbi:hypothetical protein IV203_032968 [Nitzschia inconspicua]|uniref:Integrase catalytic domain-containing protein n=1 Tax=Nitzschia inconspicua TaxID=303405 RepID=A0A9K3KKK9_9STRA|nr:hypothetical protein IV203_032968 [Nitzschia inconspicua]